MPSDSAAPSPPHRRTRDTDDVTDPLVPVDHNFLRSSATTSSIRRVNRAAE